VNRFDVLLGSHAVKQLAALDRRTQARLVEALHRLARAGPTPGAGIDVKRLEGRTGTWRLRIGGYRAIFEVDGTIIRVTRIGDRKNVYRT
jgi:mRNA interferase RelE/StbE